MGGIHDMKAVFREEAPGTDLRDVTMTYRRDESGRDIEVYYFTTKEKDGKLNTFAVEDPPGERTSEDVARAAGRIGSGRPLTGRLLAFKDRVRHNLGEELAAALDGQTIPDPAATVATTPVSLMSQAHEPEFHGEFEEEEEKPVPFSSQASDTKTDKET